MKVDSSFVFAKKYLTIPNINSQLKLFQRTFFGLIFGFLGRAYLRRGLLSEGILHFKMVWLDNKTAQTGCNTKIAG